jgi:hypothetical protein
MLMTGTAALALSFIMMMTGCDMFTGNSSAGSPPPRYATEPYTNNAYPVASAYDDTSYYYVFLLGTVKNTPLAYRQNVRYNGISPISVEYSSASITKNP